jgi:hypothetical protein
MPQALTELKLAKVTRPGDAGSEQTGRPGELRPLPS